MANAPHKTPEAAAVADWPAAAAPVVVSVDNRGDRAEVVVDVNGDYRYWVYLRRDEQGWVEMNSGNGPNLTFR
jgi:hypothetical protein